MSKPYVVLARKYRPGVFDEVLGQPAVSVTLKNALASKRIAHAYLFTGPRGVGKTTMARILAKALNCKEGPTPEPCGKCQACLEIASSSSIDVLEMDAASHTGVDNIREVIIETVALAPARDRYKVFIIDETHMLSSGAFNALLKTLEEPPPHVVFILATTELAKVPATIASRCQRFKFRPISVEDLASHLVSLAKKEKIDIAEEAVELLARNAEGALRDAVSLLDQCRSFAEGKVTAELIREMFGLVPQEMLQGMAQALIARDAAGLGRWLERIYEEGVDPAQVLRDLRGALEGAYLDRLGAGLNSDPAWSKALAAASSQQLAFLLRRVNETLADLRTGDSPRLTLELGLFGCLEAAGDLLQWVERLEALERRLMGAAGTAGGVAAGVASLPSATPASSRSAPVIPNVSAPTPIVSPAYSAPAAAASGAMWRRIIESIRPDRPMLATTLESGRLVAVEGGGWKLLFNRGFDADQAKREQALIEAKLATDTGGVVSLLIETGEAPASAAVRAKDPGSEAPAALDDAPPPEPAKPVAAAGGLKRAAKILGGTAKFIKKKDA